MGIPPFKGEMSAGTADEGDVFPTRIAKARDNSSLPNSNLSLKSSAMIFNIQKPVIGLAILALSFATQAASAQYVSPYDRNRNVKSNAQRASEEARNSANKSSYRSSAGNTYGGSENAFTGGIKVGVMPLSGLNKAVAAYNEERPWLSTKMPEFRFVTGWEASWQYRGRKWGYEVSIGKVAEANDAKGMEPATSQMGYRRAKVGMGGISMGLLLRIYESEHISVLPALGFDVHFLTGSSLYSSSDSYAGATSDNEVSEIVMANTLSLNVSLFAVRWLGINLRPYAQVPWGSGNLQGILPYSSTSGGEEQAEWPVNAGISASLIVALGRDY